MFILFFLQVKLLNEVLIRAETYACSKNFFANDRIIQERFSMHYCFKGLEYLEVFAGNFIVVDDD